MSRGPDAATLFGRAIEQSATVAGCVMIVTATRATRWASATFTGAQHRLTIDAVDDETLAAWLAGVGDAELPMRGHLVADIVVISVSRRSGRAEVVIEGLTVET